MFSFRTLIIPSFNHLGELRRQRGREIHVGARHRMSKAQSHRMQSQTVDGRSLGAVLAVAGYRMAEIFHVDSYLILSAGFELQFYEGVAVGAAQAAVES